MKTIIHKERLKEALIARKMEPATLAKLAGVGNRTVRRILHAPTADVPIRHDTLFQIAAVLHVSADFLRNKTAVTTPDAVTLVFRLCYLNRQMDREQKALSKCFPDHPDLQKHHAAFNRLMEEYLQTKQECAAIAAAKRANQ